MHCAPYQHVASRGRRFSLRRALGFVFFLLHIGEDILHVLVLLKLVDELGERLTLLGGDRLGVVRQTDELGRGNLVAGTL